MRSLNLVPFAALMILPLSGMAQGQIAAPDPELLHQGEGVFQTRCSVCHDHPEQDRIPPRAQLATRSADFVIRTLKTGVMRQNAAGLTDDQMKAVAVFVTGRMPGAPLEIDPDANRCQRAAAALNSSGSSWIGWSGGADNKRFQANPGISAADVPRLKLKWTFAYPGSVAGPPVIVGGRVYATSSSGHVFALDAASGCTYWARDMGVPSRTAISVGKLPNGHFAVYFGIDSGEVHALDADTGAKLWHTTVDAHPAVHLTGAPTLFKGTLYVPISSLEQDMAQANPNYHCCVFRGGVVALDAVTGKQLWKSYVIADEPKPVPDDPNHMAPAGAAVWSTPTVDAKHGLVFVGTGDAYTEPAAPESDSVVAFDMKTGARRWVRQLYRNDTWMSGCDPNPTHPACPKHPVGPDFDVGAAQILVSRPNGKDVLVAAGKSGLAFGLNPADGSVLWETKVGEGGTRGGIEWGGASDGERVFFPVSDTRDGVPFSTILAAVPATPGGVHALSVSTGKQLWVTPAPKPVCSWGSQQCQAAQPGAASMIPGVVFAGSWDGHERAYSATDGQILWDFDTGQVFSGVNGGKAKGGSVDGGSQVIAGGMLFVNSGVRMRIGSALLVFSVDGK
jgi:polyvinyl alcohol dehydrogenase (cytochrome)